MADTPAELAGFDLLRQRLSIYFGEDDEPAWYEGTVDDYDHDETSSHFAWHRVVFDDGEKRWLDLGKEAASNLLRWAGGAWPTAADRVGRYRRAAGVQLPAVVTSELAANPARATKPPQAAKLKREVGEMGRGARARRTKQPRARLDPDEADDAAEMGEVSEGDEDEGDEDEGDEEWAPAGKAEAEAEESEEGEEEQEEEEEAPVLSRKDRKRARRAAAPLKSTKAARAAKAAKGAATTHAAKGAKGGAKGGEAEAGAPARSVGASGLPLG